MIRNKSVFFYFVRYYLLCGFKMKIHIDKKSHGYNHFNWFFIPVSPCYWYMCVYVISSQQNYIYKLDLMETFTFPLILFPLSITFLFSLILFRLNNTNRINKMDHTANKLYENIITIQCDQICMYRVDPFVIFRIMCCFTFACVSL